MLSTTMFALAVDIQIAERNYPLEDVLYRYQHHVAPAYELYIQPFQEDLDLII
ncbi:MAG: hypothetical protein IPI30_12440 [Saprospiraceae bacterium]|nr:hypothetical protein [Candidatus Vicinibacter affinis]